MCGTTRFSTLHLPLRSFRRVREKWSLGLNNSVHNVVTGDFSWLRTRDECSAVTDETTEVIKIYATPLNLNIEISVCMCVMKLNGE